jgi:hypothetical protein
MVQIIGMGSKIVAMCPCRHRSGDTAPVREAAAYPEDQEKGALLNTPPCFEWHSSKSANVQSSFLRFEAKFAPEFFEFSLCKVLGRNICRVPNTVNK